MKTSLEHLPPAKQRELERVIEILFEEFNVAMSGALSEKRKRGRLLKIILFGSFARGNWVDDRNSGYKSDFDILVIVNATDLTDHQYWDAAEDRLRLHPGIKTPVEFIVETMQHVGNELAKGQYFFSDIRDEGIALYELEGHSLTDRMPLSDAEHLEISRKYFDRLLPYARDFLEGARFYIDKGSYNIAAFVQHQAAEHTYRALLLTLTHYSPATHSIRTLRGFAEDLDHRLVDAWPRQQRAHKRMFEQLRRAYVEARYSEHYEITVEELEWLETRIQALQDIVEIICKERLVDI